MSAIKSVGRGRASSSRPPSHQTPAASNSIETAHPSITERQMATTTIPVQASVQFEDASESPQPVVLLQPPPLACKPVARPKDKNGNFRYCTLGEPKTTIMTNHFAIKIDTASNPTIYRYEVEIELPRQSTFNKRQVMDAAWKEARRYFGVTTTHHSPTSKSLAYGYGYDGDKLLLTCMPLDIDKLLSEVQITIGTESFIIKVKGQTGSHALSDLKEFDDGSVDCTATIAAMDIIFQTKAKLMFGVNSRNYFYYKPAATLLRYREIWPGFFISVRPGEQTPTLNVDVTAAIVLCGVDLLELFAWGRQVPFDWKDSDVHELNKFIQEMKPDVEIFVNCNDPSNNNRKRRFDKVVFKTASTHSFPFGDDGKAITMMDYYLKVKKYQIKFPNLPLVQVKNSRIEELYPLEVCAIVAEQLGAVKKGSDDQTQLVRFMSSLKPQARYRKTKEDFHRKVATSEVNQCLDDFAIEVSDQLMVVEKARVLPPVVVTQQTSVSPNTYSWAVISTPGRMLDQTKQVDWIKSFWQTMAKRGTQLSADPTRVSVTTPSDLKKKFAELSLRGIGILIFFVDKRSNESEGKEVYAHIKQMADREFHIPTQCVDVSKFDKPSNRSTGNAMNTCMSRSYLENIALKVNDKLGRVNALVDQTSFSKFGLKPIFDEPVLLLGADVTHPSGREKTKPSIVAVVGNIDRLATKYVASVTAQYRITGNKNQKTSTQECISNFQAPTKAILERYVKTNNGQLPKKLLVYRDGVSEGQFEMVLRQELPQIKAACEEAYKDAGFLPKITMIVVCKRVHTKFFYDVQKGTKRHEDDTIENVPPGTVVEGDVTQPKRFFEWYMVPHSSPLGTAKPTRYVVLYDDSNFSPDELEYFSFSQCHAFPRCNKAISLPTPVYHAHLAADRANNHLLAMARTFQAHPNVWRLTEEELVRERERHLQHVLGAVTIDVSKCVPNYWV